MVHGREFGSGCSHSICSVNPLLPFFLPPYPPAVSKRTSLPGPFTLLSTPLLANDNGLFFFSSRWKEGRNRLKTTPTKDVVAKATSSNCQVNDAMSPSAFIPFPVIIRGVPLSSIAPRISVVFSPPPHSLHSLVSMLKLPTSSSRLRRLGNVQPRERRGGETPRRLHI